MLALALALFAGGCGSTGAGGGCPPEQANMSEDSREGGGTATDCAGAGGGAGARGECDPDLNCDGCRTCQDSCTCGGGDTQSCQVQCGGGAAGAAGSKGGSAGMANSGGGGGGNTGGSNTGGNGAGGSGTGGSGSGGTGTCQYPICESYASKMKTCYPKVEKPYWRGECVDSHDICHVGSGCSSTTPNHVKCVISSPCSDVVNGSCSANPCSGS